MLFIGPFQIQETTPDGEFVNITFVGRAPMRLKKMIYEKLITAEAVTLNDLQDRWCLPVVQKIVGILLEWDVRMDDVQNILSLTENFVMDKAHRATARLWQPHMRIGTDPNETPGAVVGSRTIGDINDLLESDHGKDPVTAKK